jgi:hypothetical protein
MARSDSFQKKWAAVPSQFERPSDALIARGWAGGAAEDPPEAKWENWWHNRVDEALAEIEANGAMQWFANVPYGVGASVRSGGKNWIAAIASTGVEPGSGSDAGHWQELSLLTASQPEAEEGTDNVKRMTPLRVLQAIKAQLINATEAVVGMLRVGTQVEVDAGVLDGVAVTPKKLRWGFSASWTTNGYVVFPSWLGGLVIQWGRVAPAARQADGTALGPISYPIQFPNAVFGVYGQMIGGEAVPLGSLDGFLFVKTVGLSSFNLISGFSAPATFEFGAYWVAFGR